MCGTIHAMKQGGNWACGRDYAQAAHAFSAGIECWHCMYSSISVFSKLVLSDFLAHSVL